MNSLHLSCVSNLAWRLVWRVKNSYILKRFGKHQEKEKMPNNNNLTMTTFSWKEDSQHTISFLEASFFHTWAEIFGAFDLNHFMPLFILEGMNFRESLQFLISKHEYALRILESDSNDSRMSLRLKGFQMLSLSFQNWNLFFDYIHAPETFGFLSHDIREAISTSRR